MHAILISLAFFGQADIALPPVPAAESLPTNEVQTVEQMRAWLMAQLIIDMSFDVQKSAEVRQLLDGMNEEQMRILIGVYKERSAKRDLSAKPELNTQQKQLLDQAKSDLQQAEALRDHLKQEYDRRILQGYMTQNLVYQNLVNNQRAMLPYNNPFAYGNGIGPYGYGGITYGPMNYGWYGYGVPGLGSSVMYGGPFVYGGMGF